MTQCGEPIATLLTKKSALAQDRTGNPDRAAPGPFPLAGKRILVAVSTTIGREQAAWPVPSEEHSSIDG